MLAEQRLQVRWCGPRPGSVATVAASTSPGSRARPRRTTPPSTPTAASAARRKCTLTSVLGTFSRTIDVLCPPRHNHAGPGVLLRVPRPDRKADWCSLPDVLCRRGRLQVQRGPWTSNHPILVPSLGPEHCLDRTVRAHTCPPSLTFDPTNTSSHLISSPLRVTLLTTNHTTQFASEVPPPSTPHYFPSPIVFFFIMFSYKRLWA